MRVAVASSARDFFCYPEGKRRDRRREEERGDEGGEAGETTDERTRR